MGTMAEEYVKFCMRCGSTALVPWVSAPDSIDPRMVCRDCNSIGYPLEGTRDFLAEYREELRERGRK